MLRAALAPDSWSRWVPRYAPGMLLCASIGVAAYVVQRLEEALIGHALIESLVIAIVIGMVLRTLWVPPARAQAGIKFMGKEVLEFAIVLLGASIDVPVLAKAGPPLVLSVVLLVAVGITASVAIGRAIGLRPKLAILVACGNAICGNSAIAAVAPVIGADRDDIASAIALTAVLGVVVVLLLPLLIPVLSFSYYQYGVLAGMTVYAVPQVLAATFPVNALSGTIGTLVKLVRVLMLGPVMIFYAFRYGNQGGTRPSLSKLVPWFLTGFLLLAAIRSVGLLQPEAADALREIARWLTVLALAALGLGVELRTVSKVGRPVAMAVTGSLLVLIVLSVTLIKGLGITGG